MKIMLAEIIFKDEKKDSKWLDLIVEYKFQLYLSEDYTENKIIRFILPDGKEISDRIFHLVDLKKINIYSSGILLKELTWKKEEENYYFFCHQCHDRNIIATSIQKSIIKISMNDHTSNYAIHFECHNCGGILSFTNIIDENSKKLYSFKFENYEIKNKNINEIIKIYEEKLSKNIFD